MEETNKLLVCQFLLKAKKKFTCNLCGLYLMNRACQCYNGHPVCRRCAISRGRICSNCKMPYFFNRCILLDNIAECLLEVEKVNTYEHFTRLLECTVCYEKITPDFKLCIVGHAVCNNCWTRLVVCPICNHNYCHITNKLLLDLLNIFPYRCMYYHQGCETMGCYSDIVKHELRCRHREFYCQMRKCCWRGGNERHLVSHIKDMHQETSSSDTVKLALNMFRIQHNMAVRKTRFVTYKGKNFWQHYYCIDGHIKFVAIILGSLDEAKGYKAVVSGNDNTKTFRVFSDEYIDVNTCFNDQYKNAHDITNLVTQKLIRGDTGEYLVVNECKVTIQKSKPVMKLSDYVKLCDLLSITVFGGFILFLLFKGNR